MIGTGGIKMMTIYHNKSCSKSCSALTVLEESGKPYQVIEYLSAVPSIEELKGLVEKLQCKAHDLIRTNEKVYVEQFKGKDLSDDEWIKAMHENPILIQRPIVVDEAKAIIVRTAEALESLK